MIRKRKFYVNISSVIAIIMIILIIIEPKSSKAEIIINYSKDSNNMSKIQGKIISESNKPIESAKIKLASSKKNNKKIVEVFTNKDGYFDLKLDNDTDRKLVIKPRNDSQTSIIELENKLYTTQKFTIPNYKEGPIIPIPFVSY